MTENISNTMTLQRPLLQPRPMAVKELQEDLIHTVKQHRIPLSRDVDVVRFVSPDAVSISVVSSTVIQRAIEDAASDSELRRMRPEQIATYLESKLPWPDQEITARTIKNCLPDNHRKRSALETRLEHPFTPISQPTILSERRLALRAVRSLAGLPAPKQTSINHSVAWVRFMTICPEALKDDLVAVLNHHLPAGSELVFGAVTSTDMSKKDPYLPLE